MRTVLFVVLGIAAVVGLLAFLRPAESGIGLTIIGLPEGTNDLDMGDGWPRSAKAWDFEVQSFEQKRVRLQIRLEDAKPGMNTQLHRDTDLLHLQRGKLQLIIAFPSVFGPFECNAVVFSDDLPEWSRVFRVHGTCAPKKLEGAALRFDPRGVDLGRVRPGATVEFSFAIRNPGGADLVVVRPVNEGRNLTLSIKDGVEQVVVPGGALQVNASLRVLERVGPFTWPVIFESNDRLRPKHPILISGVVAPRYAAQPPSWRDTRAVSGVEATVKVRVVAEQGEPPFTIEKVEGAEPYFSVVSTGGKDPAGRQPVVLKRRRDAPHGSHKFEIGIHLAPSGYVVRWPVTIRIVAGILAQPNKLTFGKIRPNQEPTKELTLHSLLRRSFTVTRADSAKGKFTVKAVRTPSGSWRLLVTPVPNLPPGFSSDRIVIETDDPDTPRLIVEVFAEMIRAE